MTARKTVAIALCLLCGLVCAAVADETAELGRAVFEANKDTVVTVRSVVSLSFGGEESERESWANGTIVDGSGLTIVALSLLDPTQVFKAMGRDMGEVGSKVVSLNIVLPDGTEIPAEEAIRDKDLDLALLRPIEKPQQDMPHVDLENTAEPQILDELAILAQLGEVARRAHSVMVERVESIVEKPLKYFVIGEHRMQSVLSSPAFTLDGRFVGVGTMRAIKSKTEGGRGDNILVIVVPAEKIKEAVAQVPEK